MPEDNVLGVTQGVANQNPSDGSAPRGLRLSSIARVDAGRNFRAGNNWASNL